MPERMSMHSLLLFLFVFAAVGIGLWLVSFLLEALRPRPTPPAKLLWAPDIPIDTVEIDGNKLRFIKAGSGPTLVLLHTLRTQLDLFEKMVPRLAKHFTVYALRLSRATAFPTFPRRAMTPTSSPRSSKASCKSSTCAT